MYSFLDGLVHLAFSDYTPLQGEEEELNLTRKRGNIDVHSMVRLFAVNTFVLFICRRQKYAHP